MSDQWIWIAKWDEFQHYKPEPHKPPAWIKDYTKQLRDDRYLALTDRQRALLRDLRDVFAVTFGRVPRDTRAVSRHRHSQTLNSDIDALNHAGFIDIISREVLEQRLEHFYSPLKSKSKKESKETPLPPSDEGDGVLHMTPREAGTSPRSKRKVERREQSLRDFVARSWDEYPDLEVLVDELVDRGLEATDAWVLIGEEQERRSEEAA